MSKINLVVVAHPDDEILGFGAAGAALADRGDRVQPLILCGDVDARNLRPRDRELAADINAANKAVGFDAPIFGSFPNIRMNTVAHIELVQFIEQNIAKVEPHRIFTHHPGDLNDDHRQVSRACLAASRLFQRRPGLRPMESLYFMEIQSATDWSMDTSLRGFQANVYVEVGDHIGRKLEALRCYRNVMRDYPHPRSEEAIRALAAYRGAQVGMLHAEAFETIYQRGLC